MIFLSTTNKFIKLFQKKVKIAILFLLKNQKNQKNNNRDAGGGGEGGGHVPPQVLGYQLTLFGPREADYARHITSAPHLFGQCGVSEQHYFIHLYLIFRLSKGLDKIYKT